MIKIRKGSYIYRGYYIECLGYYEPEHHIVWEAVDENGNGFAHSYSLKDVKREIDYEIQNGLNEGILTIENINIFLKI